MTDSEIHALRLVVAFDPLAAAYEPTGAQTEDRRRLGVMLAALRNALDDPHISVRYQGTIDGDRWTAGPWVAVTTSRHVSVDVGPLGDTEELALLLALRDAFAMRRLEARR